jgi:uncharacterized OB-fold protein
VSKPVKSISAPIRLDYTYAAGEATTRFLRGIARKKLIGQRCPITGKVYVPSAGASPTHGVPTTEEVEVSDKGTITTFCIVRIPAENLSVQPPFVAASVLLDGADIAMFHVVSECPVEEVRMGMRVQAVWVPDEEIGPTLRSIQYFKPIDEPDADFDSYKEHL